MKKLLFTAAVIACGASFASAPIYKAAAPSSICPAFDYGVQLGSSGTNQSQGGLSNLEPQSSTQGFGFYASKDCVSFSTVFSALKFNGDDYTTSSGGVAGNNFTYYATAFELSYAKPITQSVSSGLGLSYGRLTSTDDTAANIKNTPYDVSLNFLLSQKLTDRFTLGYSAPIIRYMNNGQTENTSTDKQKNTAISLFGFLNQSSIAIRYRLA